MITNRILQAKIYYRERNPAVDPKGKGNLRSTADTGFSEEIETDGKETGKQESIRLLISSRILLSFLYSRWKQDSASCLTSSFSQPYDRMILRKGKGKRNAVICWEQLAPSSPKKVRKTVGEEVLWRANCGTNLLSRSKPDPSKNESATEKIGSQIPWFLVTIRRILRT